MEKKYNNRLVSIRCKNGVKIDPAYLDGEIRDNQKVTVTCFPGGQTRKIEISSEGIDRVTEGDEVVYDSEKD